MKRLIVNADDFGLTRGVNRAIVDAHQQGAVTSATLMANGPEFEQAVNLARFTPSLAIGCHVDLVQLGPVAPVEKVGSLIAADAGAARFRQGIARLFTGVLSGKVVAEEIFREAAAQMRKLQSAGLRLTHFDSHKHTHAFPPVLRPLLRAARECGLRAVRNPFEPAGLISPGHLASWRLRARYGAVRLLGTMARQFRREVEEAGLATPDGTLGIVFTGSLDQRSLCELLRSLPEGTWELVTHPGYSDVELGPLSTLVESREVERALLTSAETREQLETCGIELISYAALQDVRGKDQAG